MKVKCPKCRLTFEVTSIPGITEVSCVCPRCGTPFTYQVTDDAVDDAAPKTEPSPSADEAKVPDAYVASMGDRPAPPPLPSDRPSSPNESSSSSNPASSSGPVVPPAVPPLSRPGSGRTVPPAVPPSAMGGQRGPSFTPVQPRRRGCFLFSKGCLILVVLLCLAAALLNDRCTREDAKEYDDRLAEGKTAALTADSSNAGPSDVTTSEDDAQGAPAWIQGSWSLDDDGPDGLGHVQVVIHGDKLQETIDGQESVSGSFTYSAGTLHFVADSGDGHYDYHLDNDHQRIEWQSGKYLHRAD